MIKNPEHLNLLLKQHTVGEHISVELIREKTTLLRNFPLSEYPLEQSSDFDIAYNYFEYRGLKIRTILTKKETNPIIVLLLQGIDCKSIDAPFSQRNIYRAITHTLTNFGVSTARVELFGNGDSDGTNYDRNNFVEIVNLYETAVKHLFDEGYQIVLFGYSLGGVIAPIIANHCKGMIKSIVVFDTIISCINDYLIENKMRQALIRGQSKHEIMEDISMYSMFIKKLLNSGKSIRELVTENTGFSKYVNGNFFVGHTAEFFRELNMVDPMKEWRSISVPVLIVVGENDYAINHSDHIFLFDELNKKQGELCKQIFVPLNHSFCYENGTFGKDIIALIAEFSLQQYQKSRRLT